MKFTEVAEAGKRGGDLSKLFFKEEYMLNYAIGELWFEVKTILMHSLESFSTEPIALFPGCGAVSSLSDSSR